ncbi:lytic transglycosylase domain-containing protein [Brucella rhizosphaerae]|uniref:Transglycosylase SLT domain protein n=1 Tax=Brucella rhizosphaerae TaxID=571254 RepID=A0A256FEI3_9HYPH|nr:lytic transglycosylase domain-containing protein [Brucella rhizosphaerae]OYR12851.1 transglycosylase SLT domain protein [Brucella rhizosphaerae]
MSRLHITIATFAFMQLFSWPESINAVAQTAANPESLTYGPPMPPEKIAPTVGRICQLIEINAEAQGIPKDFFARLIWKESRFDHRAVSPVGAQGIAQFMPYTAKERGLADPFDIEQAIPASAGFLSELKRAFGNWGLAAAAYNAGPTRVSNWIRSGGFLPLETEDYVLDLTGAPADNFASGNEIANKPLDAKLSFTEACERLPIVRTATIPMSRIKPKPWGIQVAGNFRRSVAVNQWSRLRKQFSSVLAGHDPVISRVRTPMARRGIYAVRIGANSRSEADNICSKLRAAGGACIVLRNR